MKKEVTLAGERVGVSKAGLYSKIATRQGRILSALFKMLDSENEMVALGAARTLINKILPDLQAVQHKGEVEIRLPAVFIPEEVDE